MTHGHEADTRRGSRTVLEPAPLTHTTTRRTPMHSHRSHRITALAVLFAVGLAEAPVFAQGVSPWLNAVDVLQTGIHRPPSRAACR